MKILLVHPPIPNSYYNQEFYVPSSMVYLAAVLKQHGHQVKILDLNTLRKHGQDDANEVYETVLRQTLSEFQADLLGFGCLFSGNFPDVERFARGCKAQFPNVPIIAGGIHFTLHARDILANCPCFDYIALGEAENSILNVVEQVQAHGCVVEPIKGIAGRFEGKVVVTERSGYIGNIDEIPLPAYDLVDFTGYAVDTSMWHNPKGLTFNTSMPIVSSRSCPQRCTFCSMFMTMGPRWRARSPENVVDEIEHLYRDYGQCHFSFMDDNFTFNKDRTLAICELIHQRGLNIQFETPNGVSMKTLDADVIDALVGAGLVRVSLAIESGSEFIRNKTMKKHLATDKIYEVVDICRRYPDLYTKAFFIIGMPEETHETLQETYDMIERIRVDRVYIQNVMPFSGTALFKQAKRDNLLVDVDTECLYRTDGMYITNYDRFFIKPYALELEDLRAFRRRCEDLLSRLKHQPRPAIQAIPSQQPGPEKVSKLI